MRTSCPTHAGFLSSVVEVTELHEHAGSGSCRCLRGGRYSPFHNIQLNVSEQFLHCGETMNRILVKTNDLINCFRIWNKYFDWRCGTTPTDTNTQRSDLGFNFKAPLDGGGCSTRVVKLELTSWMWPVNSSDRVPVPLLCCSAARGTQHVCAPRHSVHTASTARRVTVRLHHPNHTKHYIWPASSVNGDSVHRLGSSFLCNINSLLGNMAA